MKTLNKEKKLLRKIPQSAGVYFFKSNKEILYIGKAKNLKSRVSSYFLKSISGKTKKMFSLSNKISYIVVNSELEALLLEARLVKKFKPRYNIQLKDDKNPLYIRITEEKYPRVLTARKVNEYEQNIAFYGPFPSSRSVRSVLKMLRRTFPYSDHKVAKRPCLYSQIGLCNPCPNMIENIQEQEVKRKQKRLYLKQIRTINNILGGDLSRVTKEIKDDMKNLSSLQKYEDAALLRDKIEHLEYVTQPTFSISKYITNPNFIEDVRRLEVTMLATILVENGVNLRIPQRIECYDVAHIAGTSPTASMVTFIDGQSEKRLYRHFKIRQKKSRSDTDSMREVAKRRKKHFSNWGKPDLIIVDGGKPQVSIFFKELESYSIPIIGVAKRFETLIIPIKGKKLSFKSVRLQRSPALNLVQRMRDEAHRFARRYHHKLVSKELFDVG